MRWVHIAIFLLLAMSAAAQTCEPLQIHFFYSTTCPHCHAEKPLLEEIDNACEQIDVSFIIASENRDLWQEYTDRYQTSIGGVPMTFIGDKAFIGYSDAAGDLELDPVSNAYIGYRNQIIAAVQENVGPECNINELLEGKVHNKANPAWALLILLLYGALWSVFRNKGDKRLWYAGMFAAIIITVFVLIFLTPETLIKDFAGKMPFPLFVFIVALADGFNPCAFTVLIILLSLLTYTKRRKDMAIIGSLFIATSAIMYFIFIMAMIMVGSWALEKYGSTIMLVLGLVITIAGAINLKDFFFFHKGVSLTISDKQKSSIMKKAGEIARSLQDHKSFWIALGSTVLLAIFVNIVELGCTAILPTVYMASLVNTFGKDLGMLHVLWTGFYSVVYIIPLFAILANFIYTFRSARLTEKQGRVLKMVSGLFMLLFGMIMIFNPNALMFG